MNGFFKVHGAERADNKLNCLSEGNYALYYSYGEDELGGYRWRKNYDHKPTLEEVKEDIEGLINEHTHERILAGMEYEGAKVWLSTENQLNFRVAVAPVRLKIGEDEEGKPTYKTFDTDEALAEFGKAISTFVATTLNAGWDEKDGVDYGAFTGEE